MRPSINHVDSFLRSVEARYPSIYEMMQGDRARRDLMDMQAEIERSRRRIRNTPNILARATESRLIRKSFIGGTDCSAGHMEEVPVLIVR